jgi:two-component system, OmpR family, sensor histidine kinase CiaH
MRIETKKIKFVFIIFWMLLAYTIVALSWWFIDLSIQNNEICAIKIKYISTSGAAYKKEYDEIINASRLNKIQYAGEGAAFILLIIAGAIFIYKGFIKELRLSRDQRNFMMAITHELKTPIAIAKLNLETLQKHKLSEAQQKNILNASIQETNRLDILCNNLLISSQIEAGGYQIIHETQNISEIVKNCADDYIARFPARVFIKSISIDIFIKGDIFLIQIAISNLIENAIKYAPKEKPITISLCKENGNAIIKIIDEGLGISEAEWPLLFKKYYRSGNESTKRAKGTGLGLYLVDRICKVHKGNISIENNPKGGSMFIFTLKTIT